ncbi:hypothetical protein ACKI14_02440 [Streptomyces turgidiscabies]|uniref:hypothetical protein n=1 Tax=Streptomyces turgidiscabies TaxID=85558 RepID=UPI0038F718CD
MTLAELITALEAADPNRVVPHGFTNPHSYRGYYHELAFEPAANVTVSDMLEDARLALGATYQGWKGGDFTMSDTTECWLSEEGRASGDTISALLVELMLTSTATDNAAAGQQTVRANAATPSSWGIYEYGTDGSVTDITAEVRRLRTELAAVEMLAPQQCPAGLHADWLVDSEYAHACPWCQIDRLRTDAAVELMPVWEAMYEPGNVSDYLIGYMNDQDAATGAAEAWLRSQSEVTGRLEWVPWGDVTPMPDGYDRWFELAQQHDDGIDTGPGIVVRRRVQPDA